MWLIRGVFGHRKDFVKKQNKIHFSIFIENRNWDLNSFFNLIMKTKNQKNSKFYFILKQKPNVPFDPRIIDRLDRISSYARMSCLWCRTYFFKSFFLGEKVTHFFYFFSSISNFDFQFSYTKRNLKIENNLIFNFRANLENWNYMWEKN